MVRRKVLRALRYVSLSEKVDKGVGYQGYDVVDMRHVEDP